MDRLRVTRSCQMFLSSSRDAHNRPPNKAPMNPQLNISWPANTITHDHTSKDNIYFAHLISHLKLRSQNSDIHLFYINYKYIIPIHKKNNMY